MFAADSTQSPSAMVDMPWQMSESQLQMYYKFKMDSIRAVNPPNYARHTSPHDFIPFVVFLVPIIALVVTFLLGKRHIEARKIERLAMIERGIDASLFDSGSESTKKYRALRLGMMFGGVGLGLIIGAFVALGIYAHNQEYHPLLILGSASLFGGLGLLAYYLVVRRFERS
jgi:hypothetical protein